MKKIVYPILLLVLTACKGNQQTTNNEFAAIPVAETIADTIAQPEVDAITSATSKPNQVSFNGRIVLSDRLKRVVDEYNNRRRDEAFANEVLDDVAEQLAKLLEELKKEKDSFKGMGIDYEEKAFYDILKAVARTRRRTPPGHPGWSSSSPAPSPHLHIPTAPEPPGWR